MKTDKNILIAFVLNICFSIFEFVGGAFIGSVAIMSDAVHDLGDAVSIGISYGLERKSKNKPNEVYTYGYGRYSVLGSVVTTTVLLAGSVIVIYNSVLRLLNPVKINYNGMIIFAVFGLIINFIAAKITHKGDSLNQKAVNLHMLEDVLGWAVVLIGAIIMRFTDISVIDPIMSICVSVFILVNAVKNLKEVLDIFLEKTPSSIDINQLKEHILKISDVKDVHHIHIWSMDGFNNYATMHIVTDGDQQKVKKEVKEELSEHGICHTTVEFEGVDEKCNEEECKIHKSPKHHHHHHH